MIFEVFKQADKIVTKYSLLEVLCSTVNYNCISLSCGSSELETNFSYNLTTTQETLKAVDFSIAT